MFGGERTIEIPTLLSEGITKKYYELNEYNGASKKYDAEKERKFYIIKATSSEKGTLAINVVEIADFLIWAYFDFKNNKIIVKK